MIIDNYIFKLGFLSHMIAGILYGLYNPLTGNISNILFCIGHICIAAALYMISYVKNSWNLSGKIGVIGHCLLVLYILSVGLRGINSIFLLGTLGEIYFYSEINKKKDSKSIFGINKKSINIFRLAFILLFIWYIVYFVKIKETYRYGLLMLAVFYGNLFLNLIVY